MKLKVVAIDNFRRAAKPLLKKHPSLTAELRVLTNSLLENPRLGTPLGRDVFKIRLAVKSKGKGKSGGMRVITYIVELAVEIDKTEQDETTIFLLTIYDKAERENISEKEIAAIIAQIDPEDF
jgi:hypothetical protein